MALFLSVYNDPLDVNGEPTALQVLIDRARMMHGAFDGLRHQIHDETEAPGRRAFAFRLTGRHVGPLETPLGVLDATGRELRIDGMDIFHVDEEADRVVGVWAIADILSLLMQAHAVERSSRSPW